MENREINKKIHEQIFGAKYYCYTPERKEQIPHLRNLKFLLLGGESLAKSAITWKKRKMIRPFRIIPATFLPLSRSWLKWKSGDSTFK